MTEIIIKVDDKFLEFAKMDGMEDQYELIRCKDCKYYKWEIDMCNLHGATVFPMNVVHEDDYCSRAERKEE